MEKLDINYGGGLQEVFNVEGLFNRGVQQNVLAIKIKYIWRGSAEHLNLKNFESLRVFGCMITIFTVTFPRSLHNLKFIRIEDCNELEHLIVKDEED